MNNFDKKPHYLSLQLINLHLIRKSTIICLNQFLEKNF